GYASPPRATRSRPPTRAPVPGARSYLDHHGENHRPAARPIVDQLAYFVVEVLLDELDLVDPLVEQLLEDTGGLLAQLLEQCLGTLAEPARDQLRLRDHAVVAADRRDDDQHAVLGEAPSVAERDVVHVPHSEPVDEGDAGLH